MPKRSKISQLPESIREWLEGALADNGFSQFELLADECARRGVTISKSAIGRHSQDLQEALDAVKSSTQAAVLIEKQVKDEGNALSGAVMTLINSQLFEIMLLLKRGGMGTDPESRAMVLAKIATPISQMARAMQSQKLFADEARAKFAALEAAAAKDSADGKKGMDLETLRRVREQIYGIA